MGMGNSVGVAHSGCLLNKFGLEKGCRPIMSMNRIGLPVGTILNKTNAATCREARLGVDNDLRRLRETLTHDIMDGMLMFVRLLKSPVKRHNEVKIYPDD